MTHLGGAQKYWYDANGNVITRKVGSDTYELTYDAENRLTQVKKNGGVVATLVYDGDGQRVKTTFGSTTTVYIGGYYEQQGSTIRKYYYAGGQRVAMWVGSTPYYLLTDHLRSTATTANASGEKYGELRYKAWGEIRYTWGATPTAYKFTGQRLDDSTGLYYYGARYYDAALGRFVQADTLVQADAKTPTPYLPLAVSYANPKILEQWNQLQRSRLQPGAQAPSMPSAFDPQFLNRYTYARNNPLAYTDPDGHIAFVALLVPGLIGAAAGGLGYVASVALTGQEFNVKSFAVATGVGFVAGALAPVVAVNAVGAVALGAVANVTQYALTQAVNEQPLSIQDAAINAGAGMVGGAIAGPYTAGTLRASVDLARARMIAPQFYKEISRQILREDVRLGLGNLAVQQAAVLLPTHCRPW